MFSSWEITCDRPSCKNAGGTFSGTVPAPGHKDDNKDYLCDTCGKMLSGFVPASTHTCKDVSPKDHKCERKALTFRSNAAFSDFIRVELDGKTLDESN